MAFSLTLFTDTNFLEGPHLDKRLMEQLLHKKYNIESPDFNKDFKGSHPSSPIFDSSKLFIIRPSMFTDAQAKGVVRSSEGTLTSAWMISRTDVAAYIVGSCLHVGDKMKEHRQSSSASATWKNGLVISN